VCDLIIVRRYCVIGFLADNTPVAIVGRWWTEGPVTLIVVLIVINDNGELRDAETLDNHDLCEQFTLLLDLLRPCCQTDLA